MWPLHSTHPEQLEVCSHNLSTFILQVLAQQRGLPSDVATLMLAAGVCVCVDQCLK